MTWAADIELAFDRAKTDMTFGQWFDMLRSGRATFYAGENMHGSAAVMGQDLVITHVAGRWDDNDAADMFRKLETFARFHGIADCKIFGRIGWKRFLAMRGFKLEAS